MNVHISSIEQFLIDGAIHRAEGKAHDEVANLYGIPRPEGWPRADWVNALHTLALGPRGTWVGTFRFVEAALRRFEFRTPVHIDPAWPRRIVGSFPASTVNKLVRIYRNGRDYLYYVTNLTADRSTSEITLCSVRTSQWEEADFSDDPGGVYTARFLPFRIRDAVGGPALSDTSETQAGTYRGSPALVEVLLCPEIFGSQVPKFYLRAGATPRTTDPLGGHLTPNASYICTPLAGGPVPIYLDRRNRLRSFNSVVDSTLPAGTRAETKLETL